MRALALIVVLLGSCNSKLGLNERLDAGAAGAASNEADGNPVGEDAADDDVEACVMTRQLQLSAPLVTDADGDGRVEPGEDLTLTVTLNNPGPLDHNWYPGVAMVSNDPGITVLGFGDWLYALLAHTSASLSTRFHVDSSLPPGTVARFVLSAAALNVHCRGVATLEYSIPIL